MGCATWGDRRRKTPLSRAAAADATGFLPRPQQIAYEPPRRRAMKGSEPLPPWDGVRTFLCEGAWSFSHSLGESPLLSPSPLAGEGRGGGVAQGKRPRASSPPPP